MKPKKIRLELSNEEALVLFEWLAEVEDRTGLFSHPSEQKVLWSLEGQLESILVEPFADNYAALVDSARRMVAEDFVPPVAAQRPAPPPDQKSPPSRPNDH